MAEYTKETVTTQNNDVTLTGATPRKEKSSTVQTVEYLLYFMLGILEVVLVFRLIFKFMGASTASSFVSLIYGITGLFIMPFQGIFSRWFNQGLETTSVLEPATIVAMVVYALLTWGLVVLLRILAGNARTNE